MSFKITSVNFLTFYTLKLSKYCCRAMPPPDKKNATKGKTILQTYLNSFDQDNEATTVITGM